MGTHQNQLKTMNMGQTKEKRHSLRKEQKTNMRQHFTEIATSRGYLNTSQSRYQKLVYAQVGSRNLFHTSTRQKKKPVRLWCPWFSPPPTRASFCFSFFCVHIVSVPLGYYGSWKQTPEHGVKTALPGSTSYGNARRPVSRAHDVDPGRRATSGSTSMSPSPSILHSIHILVSLATR